MKNKNNIKKLFRQVNFRVGASIKGSKGKEQAFMEIWTSSVLYMDKATPPAPVKLKTSNSFFSLCPLGTADIPISLDKMIIIMYEGIDGNIGQKN